MNVPALLTTNSCNAVTPAQHWPFSPSALSTAIPGFGFEGHFAAAVSRGRRPVDRAAGAALRLIDVTHVRVYSGPGLLTVTFFLLSSIQRRDKDWPLLAFLFSSITSTDKNCSETKKKGHASALPASVAGSSYLSSSKVKNKDRWTTNGIDRTVSVEKTERASSR